MSMGGDIAGHAPAERAVVLWFPDWPIWALPEEARAGEGVSLAVVSQGRVRSTNELARSRGVTGGMRLREAQGRDPQLQLHEEDPERDRRAFEPVVRALEEIASGLQLLRPGLCCLRANGPARYHGGEPRLADLLREAALAAGTGCLPRIGIADGLFAAQQAALHASPEAPVIVPPGGSAAFLAPLPVGALQRPELALLLIQLGVRTLGDFAALRADAVRDRFGPDGELARLQAAGADPRGIRPTPPAREHAIEAAWEPGLERVDEIAFSIRARVEQLVSALAEEGLVATVVELTAADEEGGVRTRAWRHPDWFRANDILDRVRWQLQGAAPGAELTAPLVRLRVRVTSADAGTSHDRGLWGGRGEDQVHRALTRVQSLLGHEAVGTFALTGGRGPAERQLLVPWGEPEPEGLRDPAQPWPGRLPGPAPAVVFDPPAPVQVRDESGAPLRVSPRGRLSAQPHSFSPEVAARPMRVRAWAGPWRLEQRWWAQGEAVHRLQLVDEAGCGWLLRLDASGSWSAEGRYQ